MTASEIQALVAHAPEFQLDSWPEPDLSIIASNCTKAPIFPYALFGDFWSDWIQKAAESKSSPPDYVGAGLLAVVSSLIGNAVWVSPWSGWKEPPVLWFALAGIPSSGKSPGLDAALDILNRLQEEIGQEFPERKRSHVEATKLAKAIREKWEAEVKDAVNTKKDPSPMPKEAMDPHPLILPRLYINDPTVEAVGYRLFQNPKGLLLTRDELAGWLGKMDKYGGNGGDRAFWLEAYGGRSYAIDRVKHSDDPVIVPHLTVSIVGGIQPDRLQSTLIAGDDDGLAARFNFIWPEPVSPKRPIHVYDDSLALIALRKLHQLAMAQDEQGILHPRIMRLSDDAAACLQEFRDENHRSQLEQEGLFLSYLGKLPGMALRLSGVFEILWWSAQDRPLLLPEMVSKSAVLAAIAFITDYLIPMARRTYGIALTPKSYQNAVQIADWILKNKIQRFNVRDDIQRNGKLKLKKADEIHDALQELVEVDWIIATPSREGGSAGRKRMDYTVNPHLWTR